MDYCPNLLNELNIEYKLDVIDVSDMNLNILCLNTRSCRNKMDELTQMVLDLKKKLFKLLFSPKPGYMMANFVTLWTIQLTIRVEKIEEEEFLSLF